MRKCGARIQEMAKASELLFWILGITQCFQQSAASRLETVLQEDTLIEKARDLQINVTTPSFQSMDSNTTAHQTTAHTATDLCDSWNQTLTSDTMEPCRHTGPALRGFLSFLRNDFNTVLCGNLESIKQAAANLYCSSLDLYDVCVPEKRPSQNVQSQIGKTQELPVFETSINAITKLCNVNSSLDWHCLTSQLTAIETCIETDVKSFLAMADTIQSNSYRALDLCRYLSMVTLCTWERLEVCGSGTSNAMVVVMDQQMTPGGGGCDSTTSGGPGGQQFQSHVYHIALSGALASLIIASAASCN